jgi:hypothetical protein
MSQIDPSRRETRGECCIRTEKDTAMRTERNAFTRVVFRVMQSLTAATVAERRKPQAPPIPSHLPSTFDTQLHLPPDKHPQLKNGA